MSDDTDAQREYRETLAEIRRERGGQIGDTLDGVTSRVRARTAAELRHLRACIIELGSGNVPEPEVMQRLQRMAESILIRKAAYAEWREEYRARFSFKTDPPELGA